MYAKVFCQIFDSSIADDFRLRHFFMDLLVLADQNGVIDMTASAISARTRIPLPDVLEMLAKLEQPDPESRTPDADGRRIERLDDHRTWGWHVINYARFRATASEEQRRERTRERVARFKQKRQQNGTGNAPVTHGNALVTHGNAPLTLANAGNAKQKQKQMQMQSTVTCHAMSQPERDIAQKPAQKAADAAPALSDDDWLSGLCSNEAYSVLDVRREHAKMVQWCQTNHKEPTRRRFVNWLNRCDRPMTATTKPKEQASPKIPAPAQFIPT